jgi:hypothetical protein
MNLLVKACFVVAKGRLGILHSGTLSNNNWGYLLEWEIPCILHVISPKIGMAFFETHIDFFGKKFFGSF